MSSIGSAAQGSGAAGGVQEKAQQAAGVAQEKAQQAAGEARGRVRDQVDERSTQAGKRVGGVAQDARSVSQTLREQGKDQPAKVVDQVADRAERFGDYLKTSDGDTILRDVEDFGRRQPWAVVGGGLLLGLVASRFLKASSTRRYEATRSGRTGLGLSSATVSSTYVTPGSFGAPYTPVPPVGNPSDLGEPYPTTPPIEPSIGPGEPGAASRARDDSLSGGVLADDPRRDPDFR